MSLAERRWLRLFALCALYVAQGIPWGFTATTIPSYLTQLGLDDAVVNSALAFTVLPYSFKWVWGPIIDSVTLPRFGRRRPWILLAQAMMAATLLAMTGISNLGTGLQLLAWMILIHTVFNALQDVAVDALAVELLDEEERGRANGLMYASKYLGGFIGGFVMVTVIELFSFDTALLVQVVILLAIMCVPLFVRERSGPPPARTPLGDVGRALVEVFTVRSALLGVFVMIAMHFTSGVIVATSRTLYITELKWDYAEFTRLTGGWGLLVGGTGAAIGGFLADLVGHRRMAGIASCLMALGWIVFAAASPWWSSKPFIYALAMYEPLCQSMMIVSLFAVCMDLTHPPIAGSQFAAYMALSNFATVMGYQVATQAQEWWTYPGIWAIAGVVQIAATALLLPLDPTETRRTLPRPPGTPVHSTGVIALALLFTALIGFTLYVTVLRLSG